MDESVWIPDNNWYLLPVKNIVIKNVLYLNNLLDYLFNKIFYAGKMINVQVSELFFISRWYAILQFKLHTNRVNINL